ncbi:MAG: aspartate/glutamate racemase family protein [Clostridia bacterium]|nr:aspartate/glutamate racemase family protein [Clostridia bacterium]
MKIGVIAGTPVDTRMGVDYILAQGQEALGFACSDSAEQQNEMQILHKEELLQIAIDGCLAMVAEGAEGIFVYCNSLSGAIDIDRLKQALPVTVVTPLDIYRDCAAAYRRLAVLAANGHSLAAIERTILAANPECSVFGAGLLPLVVAIETGAPAGEIYERLRLRALTDSFAAIGCDALILGCTHYPYLGNEIRAGFAGEVIDPADRMLEVLRAGR